MVLRRPVKRLWSPEAVGWRAYILIYTTGKPKPIQEVEQVQVGEVVEELKEEVEVEWEGLADITTNSRDGASSRSQH